MNNDLSSEVEDGKSDHFRQIVLLEFTSNFTQSESDYFSYDVNFSAFFLF